MALTMKNFNVLSVHWKICFLGKEFKKTNIEGMSLKKGGFGQFSDLRGGKKEGIVFFKGEKEGMVSWQERGNGVF